MQADMQLPSAALLATELADTLLQAAVATGVAVLCVHLYLRYRRSWFGWYALAWCVYVARMFCILIFLMSSERVWLYWHQVTTGWTALALLWASLVFSRELRWRSRYLWLALFPTLWSYVAIYQLDHFLWAALPAVLFLSAATLWTGLVFWRHARITGSTGARLLSISFVLWGLHHLDYPFLRAQGAWAPWGYYLDIGFILLVAAGLVLLILDDLGRGIHALSALSGDLQRPAAGRDSEDGIIENLLARPLSLPGVRGAAMYFFDTPAPNASNRKAGFDGSADARAPGVADGEAALLAQALAPAVAVSAFAPASAPASAMEERDAVQREHGRFVSGAGYCSNWTGNSADGQLREALSRIRVTRRPQVVAAAVDQPFVAVLPVAVGARLVGALVMVSDVRNPFTALDDNFLMALGQQVGAALDQWALDRQLAARSRALERLSTRMVQQHEEERRRLSRELHDETAQVFSAVKMQLQALRPLLARGAEPRLDRTLALVDTGIASIRQVTSDLRPTLLDDLGLRPALHSLAGDFTERTGIPVAFRAPQVLPELAEDADLAVFRALQEALSNVLRHAQASRVEIDIAVGARSLALEVRDDGCGFPLDSAGRIALTDHRMGLTGMRERLLAVGGSLSTENRGASHGAILRIVVPVGAQSDTI